MYKINRVFSMINHKKVMMKPFIIEDLQYLASFSPIKPTYHYKK